LRGQILYSDRKPYDRRQREQHIRRSKNS
jgi:hypothetical protein